MTNSTSVKFTIHFIDPDLDAEDKNKQVQRLIAELREMEEVDAVKNVPDPNPTIDSRAIGGFLVGLLTAEVNAANAKKLMEFLGYRLVSKPIKLTVEANGKKLSVEAHGPKELEAAIKASRDFLEDR